MKKLTLTTLTCTLCAMLMGQVNKGKDFSFVFMNDIHLIPDRGVIGFEKAIDKINYLNPDFVISGGDLIMDANEQTEGCADSLFNLYLQTTKRIKAPIYTILGNHDIFGLLLKQGITSKHPLFGKKMYEAKIGKRYQTFIHKGWKFFLLDDVDISISTKYIGKVDSIQMLWISKELAATDRQTPIVIVVHIPFISVFGQIDVGGNAMNLDNGAMVNSKQVLDLFKGYNLKLVLQGHKHFYEDIYVPNIRFITGGTVSGWKWNGPSRETPPGFLQVNIKNGEPSGTYIDYGWRPISK
jgi:3',5'-cyclic-AMP phosphodiesterase